MSTKNKDKNFEPFRTIIIAGALALTFRSFLFEPFNIPVSYTHLRAHETN